MAQETAQDAGKIGLVWFRSGLRLADNTALYAALRENEAVRCLYVLDDTYLRGPDIGAARAAFLFDSLAELAKEIAHFGGQLLMRTTGDVPGEVLRVAREVGAGRIYANEDYLPYPRQRDRRTAELARAEGRELRLYRDSVLADITAVLTEQGEPFPSFTPFKKEWDRHLHTPKRYPVEPLLPRLKQKERLPSAEIPVLVDYGLSLTAQIEKGGAKRAQERLAEFVGNGLANYHQNRDFCGDPDSSSRLSMHIKWGTLSVRDAYRTAREIGGTGPDKWIYEFAWREFFHALLFHYPENLDGPMHPTLDDFPWSDNADHLAAWKAGMTGHPFVDAGMRQLNQTGWMHNRTRQVVASYLTKDYAIHWQTGERYFMERLCDGDWPANNGNWQYLAGCGTDPRSGSRIFNPTTQRERYDPDFLYVKRWVPEYGTARYPRPLLTHEEGRTRYMRLFGSTIAGRKILHGNDRRNQQERLF